jgi:Protein of unknown function (DUF3105)
VSRSQTPDRTPDETTGRLAGTAAEPASTPTAQSRGGGARAQGARSSGQGGGSSGQAGGPSGQGARSSGQGPKAQGGRPAGKGGRSQGARPTGQGGRPGGQGGRPGGQGGRPAGHGARPSGQATRPKPGRHRLSASERAAIKRRKRVRAIVIAVVTVVVVGSITGVVLLRNASQDAAVRSLSVQTLPDQGRTHLASGGKYTSYNSIPPTSGPHDPTPAPCGVSTQPIPNEVQVHDLEHGVIMVQYRPGLDQAQVQELASLGRSYSSHVLVAPYPGLGKPVAVTAWTKLMTLDSVDTGKIRTFIDLYRQHGPEGGIPCPIG